MDRRLQTGSPTGSNVGYAGPLTKSALLGNVAIRIGRKIAYNASAMRITNDDGANALLHPGYRKGWKL